jgi:putative ABC transport system substrate-binding protein
MTNRRTFLTVLGCGLLAAPLAAEGQQPDRVYRIGYLSPSMPAPSLGATSSEHLLSSSLRDLGYVEGRNLVIERQFAEGEIARLPGLAGDLVQHRVDVIVAVANSAILAAKEATTTIPIVMGFGSEPVERGFVMSFARPGGNVTGVTLVADTTLAAKRLELLREAVPSATRIAVLTTDEIVTQREEAENAAARLGVRLVVAKVRAHDYERAFATMVAGRARALFVLSSPVLFRDRQPIIELAAKHRLPAMYEWREHVADGGLMAYGASLSGLYGRVATYVDRIFKGANPAELPVEQPDKFAFVINLKTAKALGLTIPPSLLLRADQVIE